MNALNTATKEAMNARLDEEPRDWDARRELADLLEEAGQQDQAALQRWLVRHRKCPCPWRRTLARRFPNDWKYREGEPEDWCWHTEGDIFPESCLGDNMWDQIFGSYFIYGRDVSDRTTRAGAEERLLAGLRQHPRLLYGEER